MAQIFRDPHALIKKDGTVKRTRELPF